ncbi:Abi-like protein [Lentilactobacillus sunkii]|uniref:Abi-like protein n=1 Tax=Lentilactobacillus sunkii TaxID=481719 RepID=A0A1E7X8M2_9LACO|nr:Abi family protein [Lentilactobacillus sunkii]OFA09348.1 Abi-like protein [Lentilactobacillus sunkii]
MNRLSKRPFKSLDDQIKVLETRGLTITDPDSTKELLLNNNYYNVINGYKDPFLKKDTLGQVVKPEVFITNALFDELFSVYIMDSKLRSILLEYLLLIEVKLKSIVAYEFAKYHSEPYAYLDIHSYRDDKKSFNLVLNNLNSLSRRLKNGSSSWNGLDYIKHYVKQYDHVPIWVLINSMTFGEVQHFFDSLEDKVKQSIAKDFSLHFKKRWSSTQKIDITELKATIKAANFFRNKCAHDERLYTFKVKSRLKLSLFNKFFISNPIFSNTDNNKTDLFTMISMMALLLTPEHFEQMISSIKLTFSDLERALVNVKLEAILNLMGFPNNWESSLQIQS